MRIYATTPIDKDEINDRIRNGFEGAQIIFRPENFENPSKYGKILNEYADCFESVLFHIPYRMGDEPYIHGCPRRVLRKMLKIADEIDYEVYPYMTMHIHRKSGRTERVVEKTNTWLKKFGYGLSLETMPPVALYPGRETNVNVDAGYLLDISSRHDCGITFDSGHSWLWICNSMDGSSDEDVRERLLEDVHKLRKRIKIVHMADAKYVNVGRWPVRTTDNLPFGHGDVPIKLVLRELKKCVHRINDIPIVTEVEEGERYGTSYVDARNQLKAKRIIERGLDF